MSKLIGNKYNFTVGDIVTLDAFYNNSIDVEIIYITEHQIYATVKLIGKNESWDVMMNRLTPCKNQKK